MLLTWDKIPQETVARTVSMLRKQFGSPDCDINCYTCEDDKTAMIHFDGRDEYKGHTRYFFKCNKQQTNKRAIKNGGQVALERVDGMVLGWRTSYDPAKCRKQLFDFFVQGAMPMLDDTGAGARYYTEWEAQRL